MDLRKELEIAGATDLAHNVCESVKAPDGPIAYAKGWLSLGQERLRFLGRDRSCEDEANAVLELDVRRLRQIIDQRVQTASDFVEAAATEATEVLA